MTYELQSECDLDAANKELEAAMNVSKSLLSLNGGRESFLVSLEDIAKKSGKLSRTERTSFFWRHLSELLDGTYGFEHIARYPFSENAFLGELSSDYHGKDENVLNSLKRMDAYLHGRE